jgi:HEPN domain-containing protein
MPKLYSAADGYKQGDLVQFSRDHLFAAEKLFVDDVRCLDSAGYLSHLGIELLLKALLLGTTGAFPNEHSLLTLGCCVKRAIPEFGLPSFYLDVLPLLDRYYELRYPTPSKLPGVVQGDWPVIREVATVVEQYLPDEVRASMSQEASCKGGRKIIRQRSDIWK